MEDDFYATIKFKNGEEIFAKVAVSEEEDRTMLVLSNPVMATEVKAKGGLVGNFFLIYKNSHQRCRIE